MFDTGFTTERCRFESQLSVVFACSPHAGVGFLQHTKNTLHRLIGGSELGL